jgi:hypothetical protein
MRPSRKQSGCCTLCGKEVFEVRARYPKDHPLAGEIRQVGIPLSIARRATLVLMSGCKATVTLCSSCTATPERLPELWTICVSANAQELEEDRRAAIGAHGLNDEQRTSGVEVVRRMVVDLPLAVLSVYRWEEIYDFAARS